jgi:U3 small nucleolar RNA-associated protein 20
MQYLLDYPMSKQRREEHLRQVVLNMKYEYHEGRMSAIELTLAIIEKLPTSFLEEYAQLLFLPLVLQLVNDDSKECREAAAGCISRLLSRSPMHIVQALYDYTLRWSKGVSGPCPLRRTSLQVLGIFIDSSREFVHRGKTAEALIGQLRDILSRSSIEEWEIPYFALLCLEKLAKVFPILLNGNVELWNAVIESLLHQHPWVKSVSSRILGSYISRLDPETFGNDSCSFLVRRPGTLFDITRNLCMHIDLEEVDQNEAFVTQTVKTLSWLVQGMESFPNLCFSKGAEPAADEIETSRDPVRWLMTRLCHLSKPKGSMRRQTVFKCFAAFATAGGASLVDPYLELMLEPLVRAITEAENRRDASDSIQELSEEATLAKDVLQMLEETSTSADTFLHALALVKARAREKRDQRKLQAATEAVANPKAATAKKIKKQLREKNRRKRKIEDRRGDRGGKKRRL